MNTGDYFEDIGFWPRGTGIGAYALGFLLSLGLTCGAYLLAVHRALSPVSLVGALAGLALLQFIVQAAYFLHVVGKGVAKERLAMFAAALVVVGIIVSGSIWIMHMLGSRMMPTTAQMEQYMDGQSGF